MTYKISLPVMMLAGVVLSTGCSESSQDSVAEKQTMNSSAESMRSSSSAVTEPVSRWYSMQQVQAGGALYQQHCAECHGPDASGTADWRQVGPDGKYPPPPLNGTAHTWHHHLDGLRRTLRVGGVPLGGSMPGFADKLSDQDVDAVLAWVQSRWSDDIYTQWQDINARASR